MPGSGRSSARRSLIGEIAAFPCGLLRSGAGRHGAAVRAPGYRRCVRAAELGALVRLGKSLRFFRSGNRLDESRREEIAAGIFFDARGELEPYVFRLVTLTALSTVIAALGLIANSVAVVIGAMLVAPLMQPIIGLAAALVLGRPRGEITSFLLIGLTTAEAFVVALLVGLIVPSFRVITLTAELLARTGPTLLDLGIAVAAGAAGAYVTVRPSAGGAIAGVAIAVALMPPLAACGVLLAHGNDTLAGGAFFLFLTNLVGIVLAAVAVFIATGFVQRAGMSRRRQLGTVIPLVVVAAVAYPLARRSLHTYRLSGEEARVRDVIVPRLRAAGLGIQNVVVVHRGGLVVASLDVTGPNEPPPTASLADAFAAGIHRPVQVIVRWTKREESIADAAG